MEVTIYKNIYEKVDGHYIDVNVLLSHIKLGRWKSKIDELRLNLGNKELKNRCKNHLPSVCFSGKFTERKDECITQHSGLAILDFDHVDNLPEFKKQICEDEYTYACFISPSGDGLKVLVKIPPEIENHEQYYLGLIQKYPNLDKTSRNISRVCFVSYDPDLYLNENSEVFKTKGKITQKEKLVETREAINTDYNKINIALEIIRNATDGNKHHALIKASRLAGGFISGGLVEEFEAVRLLELEINKKNPDNPKQAYKTIQDGIEYGKREPILKENYQVRVHKVLEEEIIIEDEPAKDVIYLDSVRDKIVYTYETGVSQGETTWFPVLDQHFRMKRGEVTLFYGIGNHGKSEFVLQLALMKAVRDNYKWAVFSPESMPEEEFYKSIIQAYIGKSTEYHHQNKMSADELQAGMDFIKDKFFLIYPENDSPTPTYINNRFKELIIKHKVDAVLIDPYNQLDNDLSQKGGREDQYISSFLTTAKRFAVYNNIFYWIITHPKGQNMQKEGGNYKCPDIFDLAGGAMWNNKCDNLIVIHRPFKTTDPKNTTVLVRSSKIKKQKLCGIPGDTYFDYHYYSNRYYCSPDNYNPLGADTPLPTEQPLRIADTREERKAALEAAAVDFDFSGEVKPPF